MGNGGNRRRWNNHMAEVNRQHQLEQERILAEQQRIAAEEQARQAEHIRQLEIQRQADEQRIAAEQARQEELRRQEIHRQEAYIHLFLERVRQQREVERLQRIAEERQWLEQLQLEEQQMEALHAQEMAKIEENRNEARAVNEVVKEVVQDLSSSSVVMKITVGNSMIRGEQIDTEELKDIFDCSQLLDERKQLALAGGQNTLALE